MFYNYDNQQVGMTPREYRNVHRNFAYVWLVQSNAKVSLAA